jgi:putative oxidoreductase
VKWLRHPWLHLTLGLLLGGVFVYASLEKIADPRAFARIVYHYQLAGPSRALGYLPANLLALTLPWVEVIAGLLLITGLWRREAAAVAALLLVSFLVAVGYALGQGIDIANCGCFSVSGEGRAAGWWLVLGDTALLAAALVLAGLSPRRPQPAPVSVPAASAEY